MSDATATTGTASRWQHLVPATLVLVLSLTVVWLSYTREPADAFLFPRLISSVMLVLAIWNFARALFGLARVGDGLTSGTLMRIAPGIAVMAVLVFLAAKALGFYAASYTAFLCVYSLYDPASHRKPGTWFKRLVITTGFMLVIYALFTLLLKVQTPRGLFL